MYIFGVLRRIGLGLGLSIGIAWAGLKGLGIREKLAHLTNLYHFSSVKENNGKI